MINTFERAETIFERLWASKQLGGIAKMCHEISYKTTIDAIRIVKEDQKEA